MSTKSGVGRSNNKDAFLAGSIAAKEALSNAGLEKCDFVFLFATADYDQNELLKGVRAITKDAPLSGCSGEGIITQAGPEGEGLFTESGFMKGDNIAGVMVFASDEISFLNCIEESLKNNSNKAGENIGMKIEKELSNNPLMLLLFPDGLTVNAKELFAGIDNKIKKPLTYCGGTAGDMSSFTKTYQYYNDKVFSDSVSCVLVSGKAGIKIGVNHGCVPLGLDKTITRAEGNKLYEIDNKPAWEVINEYLNVEKFTPEIVAAFGLGEKLPEELITEYDKYLIRTVLGQNKDGSLNLATEMPAGTIFCITSRKADKISNGAKLMAERIKTELKGQKPIAVLHFDCAGRGQWFFGKDAKEKGIDVIQKVLGKDIPWLGFYSYGEIAPIQKRNYFHNNTVVICVIY